MVRDWLNKFVVKLILSPFVHAGYFVILLIVGSSFKAFQPEQNQVSFLLTIVPLALAFQKLMELLEDPDAAHTLLRKHKLDVGAYAAASFKKGYLDKILPLSECERKAIEERIDVFKFKGTLTDEAFPVKKLFILMPFSCRVLPIVSSKKLKIECCGNLEPVSLKRSGILDRQITNTVYKIFPDSKNPSRHIRVVAEYATPMDTFYHQYTDRKIRDVIRNSFYENLKEMISLDHHIKDSCELLHFDDEKYDEGEVLLTRLQELGIILN